MEKNTSTNQDFLLSSYDFDLPKDKIAMRPIPGRHNSKLLVYNIKTGEIIHTNFLNLVDYLPKQSLLVLNQSKVIPCRLLGKKRTGGFAEIFLLSLEPVEGLYLALIRTTRKKNEGDEFVFDDGVVAKIIKKVDEKFLVKFNISDVKNYLEKTGLIPIPPYIRKGRSDELDKTDYQTVYAKELGSLAAPTAGLHFTEEVFAKLKESSIDHTFITLHVGLGTFSPIKTEDIRDHKMHSETFMLSQESLAKIKAAKKIVAVGTTSLRVLESIYGKEIDPDTQCKTDIFLYPGKEIHSIDALLTNFHLPQSSLFILVSSLIGRVKALEIYKEAVALDYRFFSYGDAMLILR
ncbi:MAG: tRNA preQ1(34) S-adenosylmethionine ribosyltransferase-isomerase QueA [Bacteriovoracales bacterium]